MSVAYIGKIIEMKAIENADLIESAVVICGKGGKWTGVVKKGDFTIGDEVEVYLQDALLPQNERFAFMERRHWRVSMARMRGAPSECLIMPKTIEGEVGDDIADLVGVTKYEKPIPFTLTGEIAGNFPDFVPKTDEINYQMAPEMVEALHGRPWIATEKADGTSCTAYWHNGHFGVCSRNWELREGNNIYWQMARKYHIEELLSQEKYQDIALQFEIVGPNIQGNPMGLVENEIRVFDAWDINFQHYFTTSTTNGICSKNGLPFVSVVKTGTYFAFDDDALRKLAEGEYPNGKQREGIVVRNFDFSVHNENRVSFKVINLLYKG